MNFCLCIGNSKWLFSIKKRRLNSGIQDFRYTKNRYIINDYSCDGESIEFVCGDNGVTYDNNCQLR